jgi:hypothetical protein
VPAYEVAGPLAASASDVATAVEEHALAAGHGGA